MASSLACAHGSATGVPAAGQTIPATAQPTLTAQTSRPEPPAPPPPAISADRAFGTAHPTVLLGAAGDGSWLAICQAREDTNGDGRIEVGFGMHGESMGDRLVPYLVLGPGPGREITRFLRSDRSGRWLVYVRDGRRWLRDANGGREIDLDGARNSRRAASARGTVPADRESNGTWSASLDFDEEGQHLLFVTADARGRRVAVLRNLADGRETEIDYGAGLLWWTGFSKEGPYILMRVVERDTNGDGVLEAPRTMTDRDSGACSTSFAAAMTRTKVSDQLSWRIARVDEPSARAVPGFETVFGDAVVRRTESGALELQGKGPVQELFPATCDAHVALANPSRDALVVSCAREGNTLYVMQGGHRLATGCVSRYPDRAPPGLPVQVVCADSAGRKQKGFITGNDLEIVILRADGKIDGPELVRSAIAAPDTAWQRRDLLSEAPKIEPPHVELCSRYWTVDLDRGQPNPPGERRVTRGTTSRQVLAASGLANGTLLDRIALGPLFWTDAVDPKASCPSFQQQHDKFLRDHPTLKPR